jgi:hypothetical protein
MLETLRTWLNGNKEYYTGVAIYATLGDNAALLSLFRQGKNTYNTKRMEEELLSICNTLKSKLNTDDTKVRIPITTPTPAAFNKAKIQHKEEQHTETFYRKKHQHGGVTSPLNEELYNACKREADLVYKEAMNLRAELFVLGRQNGFEDLNRPDLVQQRSKLAVNVVVLFKKAGKLYDRADYVKKNGRLSNEMEPDDEENEYNDLPDHLVKKTLDNLRKNYNKMVKRQATPDRVALLQKHEKSIKKLAEKWDLLNIKA